ncbi:MAG: HD domain-containing protein [Planctomycetes bacterium]|jgi:putative nucleotidyltransferase with HDIG domain|nr:HD domain-containing protein [Planctomycetota bacterium]
MITAIDIERLFAAQLARLGDRTLRAKVVEVFVEACARGGWEDPADLAKLPFTLLTDCRGVNFVEHTIAVTEGAIGLAEGQSRHYARMPYAIDMDRLVAGALLHDVGKLLEFERDGQGGFRKSRSGRCARHPISGAILAGRAGLPDEIVNMIACHAKEGDGRPQVIETVLVHQADFATFDPLVMKKDGRLIE